MPAKDSSQRGLPENHMHTIPWNPEEFAIYRGVKLVCHYQNGVAILYFPGGCRKRAFDCPGCVLPLRVRPVLLVG